MENILNENRSRITETHPDRQYGSEIDPNTIVPLNVINTGNLYL